MSEGHSVLLSGTRPIAGDEDEEGQRPDRVFMENLRKTRTLELFGPVTNKSARKIISGLLFLESDDPERPITIVQNSPGGSVTDGFAIYDTMRFIKPDVRVLCVGLTASIATITLLGAKKEHRLSLPHTEFLIHQPLIPGSIYGQASDLEITAREILKTRERINEMLAEATGQPLETIASHTNRDYWMNAEEAFNYGLIARVVASRAELDAIA